MAEFIVRMKEGEGDLTVTFEYELRSSQLEGAGPLEQEYVAGPSPALVRRLCDRIDSIVEGALDSKPGVAELVGTSQLLYNTLFSRLNGDNSGLARRLGEVDGPLLLRTNESQIPWELLHDGKEFLGLTHEIGRRTFVSSPVVGGRTIRGIARALIVGDPIGDLDSARREAGWLAEWLGGHGVECTVLLGEQATLLRIVDELAQGNYDLLHYCGHVAVPVGTKHVGLRLHGDELLDERALAPIANVGAPPIVVINGCASADRLANLCVSFMVVGAKVVVGTRYPVEEEAARLFAERFYTDLMSGSSTGASVRAARRSLARPGGVDWAAFVLYGDPAARITTTEPAPLPEKDDDYGMDPAATEMMAQVVRRAAGRGVVISMDLLAGLLSTKDMRGRATDAAGVERLALAEELLRMFLDVGPSMSVHPGQKVEFSDTIETVLLNARRRAQESGRELITIGDLITAFTAVGGGSSAEILKVFDISLAELAGNESVKNGQPQRISERQRRKASAVSAVPDGRVSTGPPSDLLFDRTGRLRTDRLDPTVIAAVRVAAFLAAAQQTLISTSMLLYGLAVADSALLAKSLRAQGDKGAAVFDRLSLSRETQWNQFSPRTRRALENAVTGTETGLVGDAVILPEILGEKTSSVREFLTRLGVDPDLLLAGIREDTGETGDQA
jgi:hypothetical protein